MDKRSPVPAQAGKFLALVSSCQSGRSDPMSGGGSVAPVVMLTVHATLGSDCTVIRNRPRTRMIACLTAAAWLSLGGCVVVPPAGPVHEFPCDDALCSQPSYYDPPCGRMVKEHTCAPPEDYPADAAAAGDYDQTYLVEPPGLLDSPCGFHPHWPSPRSFAIPVPGFLAEWHARKHQPEAPPFPRFHPLPVRPMFAPAPAAQALPAAVGDSEPVVTSPATSAGQPVRYGAIR